MKNTENNVTVVCVHSNGKYCKFLFQIQRNLSTTVSQGTDYK